MFTAEAQTVEELEKEAKEIRAFTTQEFSEQEIITLYGSLQSYLKELSQQDALPQTANVVNLMIRLRPIAVEASKQFK